MTRPTTRRSPFLYSAFFVGCVSIGLLLAWLDGIPLQAIAKAALTMAALGLAAAAVAWGVGVIRQRR